MVLPEGTGGGEQYVLLGTLRLAHSPLTHLEAWDLAPPIQPTHTAQSGVCLPKVEVHRHFQQRSGMQLRLPGQRGEGESPVQIPHIPRVAQETG